jgi:hypothetical protein
MFVQLVNLLRKYRATLPGDNFAGLPCYIDDLYITSIEAPSERQKVPIILLTILMAATQAVMANRRTK